MLIDLKGFQYVPVISLRVRSLLTNPKSRAGFTGGVTTSYSYDAFGKTTMTGSSFNSFQYTGRENDGTGLYYNRARYYNPTFQRFASEDPIEFADGLNVYAYVNNNPINWLDPLGSEKKCKGIVFLNFKTAWLKAYLDQAGTTITSITFETISYYIINEGWEWAALRNLSYPLRSSIVRWYITIGTKVQVVAVFGSILVYEAICLEGEIECVNSQ